MVRSAAQSARPRPKDREGIADDNMGALDREADAPRMHTL